MNNMGKNVEIIATEEIIRDQRVIKEARYISELGYNVEILCWDREGEFINKATEFIGDIRIKRFFPRSVYGSGWKQILSFVRFVLEVKKYLRAKNYDYFHCQNLDGTVAGFLIDRKVKIVFDMREFYEGREKNKIKKLIIRKILNFACRISWKIIHVNETQIKGMDDNQKLKLVYLPNYPNFSLSNCKKKENHGNLNISYIGGVRQHEIFENLFTAVKGMDKVKVNLHGGGTAYKKLKQIEGKYENVNITGRYNPSETAKLYSNADIIYCVYSMDNLNWKTAYPIKFYESIVTKTPIIVSKGSVLEKFLKDHDIGFAVNGENVEEIRKLIICISENKYVLEEKVKNIEKIQFDYSWEKMVGNLDKIYNQN